MERVVKRLIERGETISAMESCTGGGLANAITNIPDASRVFKGSRVTYCNEDKIKAGVSKEIIDRYTVYSSEVAEAMAKAISDLEHATYGVGITGKLKKADENNKSGDDDVVFLSIYDSENDEYYDLSFKVHYDTRAENKQEIIDVFVEKFLEITKEYNK